MFLSGNNMIHIIDFNDATDPMIVGYVTLFNEGAGSICDIDVCGVRPHILEGYLRKPYSVKLTSIYITESMSYIKR